VGDDDLRWDHERRILSTHDHCAAFAHGDRNGSGAYAVSEHSCRGFDVEEIQGARPCSGELRELAIGGGHQEQVRQHARTSGMRIPDYGRARAMTAEQFPDRLIRGQAFAVVGYEQGTGASGYFLELRCPRHWGASRSAIEADQRRAARPHTDLLNGRAATTDV